MAAKTIKIFLASSEELRNERLEITDLVEHLNKIFKAREIQFELVKWEHLDSSMGSTHKQDEYNEELKKCELCFVLFWKKFGCFTNIELQTAYDCLTKGQNPRKLYVLFKETETDKISKDLQEFKDGIVSNYGHFYDKFENIDAIKLFFLLRIEDYQNDNISRLTEVRNGQIYLGGEPVVNLDNISFISNNEDFLKMNDELKKLSSEIENKKNQIERKNGSANEKKSKIERKNKKLAENPEDEDLIDDLKELDKDLTTLNNELKELNEDIKSLIDKKSNILGEINQYRDFLLATAKKFAKYQGEQTNDRIMRAKAAFEAGDSRKANIILEETEIVAEQRMKEYKESKELTEQHRKNVVFSINELIIKASVVMMDLSQTLDERIGKANAIYCKAIELAQTIDYEKDDYLIILNSYYFFLISFEKFEEAEEIVAKMKDLSGNDPSNLGLFDYYSALQLYHNNKYDEAIKQALQALALLSQTSEYKIINAHCLQLLSLSYVSKLDLNNAINYQNEALNIYMEVYGKNSQCVMDSYFGLGGLYAALKDTEKAKYFFNLAISINTNDYNYSDLENGLFVSDIIKVRNLSNMSYAYNFLGDNDSAINKMNEAVLILKNCRGENHSQLADIYSRLGMLYYDRGEYDSCIDFNMRALKIYEKLGLNNNANKAVFLKNIGSAFKEKKIFEKALDYYQKTLSICISMWGELKEQTAKIYNDIGDIYYEMEDCTNSLVNYEKSQSIYESIQIKDSDFVNRLRNIAEQYENINDFDNTIIYYKKLLLIAEERNDVKYIAFDNWHIGGAYFCTGNYDDALAFCLKALSYYESDDNDSYYELGTLYSNIGDIYWGKQKLKQALSYKTKYLDMVCESDVFEIEDKVFAYQQVGELYLDLQKFNESIEYFQKSIEIMEENDLENDDLAMSYFNLAKACLNLGIKNNADTCFYKSLEILDKLYDDENPPTDEIMEVIQIIQSYFSNNN